MIINTHQKFYLFIFHLCDYSDACIVVKGDVIVTDPNDAKRTKELHLKTVHHLSTAFQKLMVYKLTMQKI